MSDWKKFKRHSLSADYEDITGRTWDDFVANLRENGLGERKIVLHEGMILDGWQLYRACLETGIEPEFTEFKGKSPELFVEMMNDLRRHESSEMVQRRTQKRRERVAALKKQGLSNRAIAEKVETSEAQVRKDLDATHKQTPAHRCAETSEIPERNGNIPETVTGTDGKSYPATKPQTNGHAKKVEEEPALTDEVDKPVPPGLVPVFARAQDFKDINNQLNAINRTLKDLTQHPAGAMIRLQQAEIDLKNLKRTVAFDMPYAVCPVCTGNAKTRTQNCPCRARGWLNRGSYENLPSEYRS